VSATRLPVWSVVVLLRPGGQPPQGTGVYQIPGIDGDAFVFRYHVVPLWRLDARSMRAELGLEAAPFFVAMHGADKAFVRSLAADLQSYCSDNCGGRPCGRASRGCRVHAGTRVTAIEV
jgi:hypothetical protein